MTPSSPWWHSAVVYQIFVPSFQDTNDDGFGDLEGVRQRLDYLQWLGIDAIWLSPIHPSPLADLGYDVSDFTGVHPLFGTLDDFDRLLHDAHQRGIRVLLDWVPNHTSDEHPWFVESRSSRTSRKRDWYVWRDPRPDGSPPNNWISVFGGSMWQWHEPTGQYYLHVFLEKQPDLNWSHPEVRHTMAQAMRFWLDRGVDGFRIDAPGYMAQDPLLRDNPPSPHYDPSSPFPDQRLLTTYTYNLPEVHDLLAEMRAVIDEYPERLLMGELHMHPDELARYYGRERPELHLPLNLMLCGAEIKAAKINELIDLYYRHVPVDGWPTWTISSHDYDRFACRVSDAQTRLGAMLLLTLRGTPTTYYGEELGMCGLDIPPHLAIDPQGQRIGKNRDPARTPMQWDSSPSAGFTRGVPWLPIGRSALAANVVVERETPGSMLNLFRRLLHLRSNEPVFTHGSLKLLTEGEPLVAYERQLDDARRLVVLNFSDQQQSYALPADATGRLLVSTQPDREHQEFATSLVLEPYEGMILSLAPSPARATQSVVDPQSTWSPASQRLNPR